MKNDLFRADQDIEHRHLKIGAHMDCISLTKVMRTYLLVIAS